MVRKLINWIDSTQHTSVQSNQSSYRIYPVIRLIVGHIPGTFTMVYMPIIMISPTPKHPPKIITVVGKMIKLGYGFRLRPRVQVWDLDKGFMFRVLVVRSYTLIGIRLRYLRFNPKRAGLFGPISQPGGGDSAPLRSRKPIDETSSVWY